MTLTLGAMCSTSKENEQRLPIHPWQVDRIPDDLRPNVLLEQGYGHRFDIADDELAPSVGGLLPARDLIDACDIILLPKPTLTEIRQLRDGQVLWGWPHCVQDRALTQHAIDHRLTLIAWEAMFDWDGVHRGRHTFEENNELAGYASVLQAMSLVGRTGAYGRELRAAVIGSGNAGRGSVRALQALGVADVTVLTQRDITTIGPMFTNCSLTRLERTGPGDDTTRALTHPTATPMGDFLGGFDIVVNCVLQDTDHPLLFASDREVRDWASGALIVDVSCDEGMGFPFARPTSFDDPMFRVAGHVRYYAVDHSPSYLWDSASWGISTALLPHLRAVLDGPAAWEQDLTISRAVEIRDGTIQNPKILSFQRRARDHPHPLVGP